MGRYLITGAAGFIGGRVAELLMAEGHSIVGIDNMNDSYDVRMKEHRLEKLQADTKFSFHRLDISDRKVIDHIPDERIDAVINLAARAGVRDSVLDPWIYVDSNMTGTLNMLELCRQRNVPKFVLASTSSIYGAEAPLPTPESAESNRPLQPYAASKKGAETLAHSYHFLHDIDVTVVVYFTVYGPSGRPNMSMFRFVQAISEGRPIQVFGDGEQTRGFTYIDDIARGTILALKPVGYEVINLGGHESISINALIHLIEEALGKKAIIEYKPMDPADMLASWADVSKAMKTLDWQPQVGIREGVQHLVDWYLVEREWAKDIHIG
ncbi:MAG: GDP-mannose 4,6-dehydratase [Anaerolineales bacterium]|nr:GDP-mannose 4,6-dehydratase [Anaerolineales bacterium]MCW5855574.1 GDP-mannose 4,6-dehydratase [Anaerolineales bacterium]